MAKTTDCIAPLEIDGLHGRLLTLPKRKGREILLLYGLHASLERMAGVAEYLNSFGPVTMPDLPGFGGMESFYTAGRQATLDNVADYLAAFVRHHYEDRRFSIVGLSYGFIVATKMLQRHPDIVDRVDVVVSIVGLASREDLAGSPRSRTLMRLTASVCAQRLPAGFIQHVLLRPTVIRAGYFCMEKLARRPGQPIDTNKAERVRRIKFEIELWRSNDVRTYMQAVASIFSLEPGSRVKLPVYHAVLEGDQYLNNQQTEASMKQVYREVHILQARGDSHALTVLATAEDTARYVPAELQELLSKPAA